MIVHRELSGLMERQQQMFTTLMAEREEKADRAMQELKADMEREREAANGESAYTTNRPGTARNREAWGCFCSEE